MIFENRIRKQGSTIVVSIPKRISEKMKLKPGHFVRIDIKRLASIEDDVVDGEDNGYEAAFKADGFK